jgi:hypothetical protein
MEDPSCVVPYISEFPGAVSYQIPHHINLGGDDAATPLHIMAWRVLSRKYDGDPFLSRPQPTSATREESRSKGGLAAPGRVMRRWNGSAWRSLRDSIIPNGSPHSNATTTCGYRGRIIDGPIGILPILILGLWQGMEQSLGRNAGSSMGRDNGRRCHDEPRHYSSGSHASIASYGTMGFRSVPKAQLGVGVGWSGCHGQ